MQNKYIEVKQLVDIKLCRPTDGFVVIDMDQIEAYSAAFNTDYAVNHSTPATVNDLGIHVPAEDLTFWPTSMVESFAVWLGASDPTQLPRKATDKLSVALGAFEVHIDTKEMDVPKRHLTMDTLSAPFRSIRDGAFPTMTMDIEKHLGIYGGSEDATPELNTLIPNLTVVSDINGVAYHELSEGDVDTVTHFNGYAHLDAETYDVTDVRKAFASTNSGTDVILYNLTLKPHWTTDVESYNVLLTENEVTTFVKFGKHGAYSTMCPDALITKTNAKTFTRGLGCKMDSLFFMTLNKTDEVEVTPPQDDPVEFAVCADIHERDNRRFTKDTIVVVVDGSGDADVNPAEAHNVHYYYDHANRKHSQLCERGEFGPTIGEQLAKEYEDKAKLYASSTGGKHTQSFEAWAAGFDDWEGDSLVFTPNDNKPLESGFGDLSTIKHRFVDFPSMYDCGKIDIDKELKRISAITGSVAADAGLPVDAETLASQMQLSVDDTFHSEWLMRFCGIDCDATTITNALEGGLPIDVETHKQLSVEEIGDDVTSRFQTLLSSMVDAIVADQTQGIDALTKLLDVDTGPDLVTRVQETLSGIRDHGKPSYEDVKLVLERDALYDTTTKVMLMRVVAKGEENFNARDITYETLGSISMLKFYK